MTNEYKYPLSLTSQFSFCGLPFRMDTYAGCSFGCTYCFARTRGGNIDSKKLKIADPNKIIKKFKDSTTSISESPGIISELIHKRVPVHLGGMSDPFQPIENHFKSSLIVLKYLAKLDYPVIISTKSLLVKEEPYLSLLASFSNLLVQFSFSTTVDRTNCVVEPNVPKPSILLKTINKLSTKGIHTSIRWQPFIPFYSEEPQEFIGRIANTGAIHLGFEHLKIPVEKNNKIGTLKTDSGQRLLNYYSSLNSKPDGREIVLPQSSKIERIKMVKELTNKAGLTFGAADNEFQYMSDTDCCCSGVDQLKGFENWNKFQIARAIRKSYISGKRKITFSLISNEWKPQGSIDMFINSKSRIKRAKSYNTIEDYVSNRWDDLESPFNPTRFYGVIFNNEYDRYERKVYEWENL